MASSRLIICGPQSSLVVILGWAYAQDKHVKKYAELLRSLGYSSLRFTCPATDVMSVFERPRIAWAKGLLKELQSDHLAPHRKLIFYSFSNGGMLIYHQMIKLMQTDARFRGVQEAFCGSVFDSAPSYMHIFAGAEAFTAGMSGLQGLSVKLAYYMVVILAVLLSPLIGFQPVVFWNTCREMRTDKPELYLYSTDEPLCDHQKLESLIAYRTKQEHDVTRASWHRKVYACATQISVLARGSIK
ncbi:hypothetical protein WJX84_010096 [Apatococcus fuscideae]|uniref:Transmembrane protein 53 n=1 Tax=Apatococcus fuscideae TaxID=2026836 RepID=A0AAW1TLQ1_9CHLO